MTEFLHEKQSEHSIWPCVYARLVILSMLDKDPFHSVSSQPHSKRIDFPIVWRKRSPSFDKLEALRSLRRSIASNGRSINLCQAKSSSSPRHCLQAFTVELTESEIWKKQRWNSPEQNNLSTYVTTLSMWQNNKPDPWFLGVIFKVRYKAMSSSLYH